MAIQTQLRRGTDTENDAFTGVVGEVTVDTTLDELRVHDGSRAGGFNVPNFSSIQKQTYSYATAGGTANALTLSTQENPPALVAGLTCSVKIASNNTTNATLAWGSLTATAIKKWSGGAKADLVADDLVTGMICRFVYDGTHFILLDGSFTLAGNSIEPRVYTTSDTHVPTPGMIFTYWLLIGGGGGSGNRQSGYGANNGPGGSATIADGWTTADEIGASIAITVGAAGTGGPAVNDVNRPGTSGGTSSVGSLLTAPGGAGGQGCAGGGAAGAPGGNGTSETPMLAYPSTNQGPAGFPSIRYGDPITDAGKGADGGLSTTGSGSSGIQGFVIAYEFLNV